MRNLTLSSHREYLIPGLDLPAHENSSTLLVVDHLRGAVFVQSDGNVYRYSIEDDVIAVLFSVKEYYAGEEKLPSIVGMCYFQVTDSVCLAVDKGELLSLSCTTPEEVECVGFVESGLVSMEPKSRRRCAGVTYCPEHCHYHDSIV